MQFGRIYGENYSWEGVAFMFDPSDSDPTQTIYATNLFYNKKIYLHFIIILYKSSHA